MRRLMHGIILAAVALAGTLGVASAAPASQQPHGGNGGFVQQGNRPGPTAPTPMQHPAPPVQPQHQAPSPQHYQPEHQHGGNGYAPAYTPGYTHHGIPAGYAGNYGYHAAWQHTASWAPYRWNWLARERAEWFTARLEARELARLQVASYEQALAVQEAVAEAGAQAVAVAVDGGYIVCWYYPQLGQTSC